MEGKDPMIFNSYVKLPEISGSEWGFVGSNGDQNHETEGYDEIYPTRNLGG